MHVVIVLSLSITLHNYIYNKNILHYLYLLYILKKKCSFKYLKQEGKNISIFHFNLSQKLSKLGCNICNNL